MFPSRWGRARAWSILWLLLVGGAACACSSTSVNAPNQDAGPADCDNFAGTWNVTVCGAPGSCTVAQQTCAITLNCTALAFLKNTSTGSIDLHDFSFSSDNWQCTGSISGSAFAASCSDADGGSPCTMTGSRKP